MTALPTLHPADHLPLDNKLDSDARPATAGHESRIPVLDGIRGLAILLVMAHHLFVLEPVTRLEQILHDIAHSGWWGVDLFFVLSGFLITGILFDSKTRPHYFRNFYARRTLRIFPLYYAFLFLMLGVLPLLKTRINPAAVNLFGELRGSPGWYWSYLANFHMAWVGGFTHRTLSVAWSLAIEEQFYLLWPAIVLLLARRGLMTLCGLMIIASIATRIGLTLHDPTTSDMKIYFLTPCRLDGLAIGAWIALALRCPESRAAVLPTLTRAARPIFFLAVAAIAALLIFERYQPDTLLSPALFFTLLAVVFGTLLILCISATPTSLLSRFFGAPFLRLFGTYSYAIYLIHYPVSLVLSTYVFRPAQFSKIGGIPLLGQLLFYILATAVALGLALLSWNLFEKHFLKLKKYFV